MIVLCPTCSARFQYNENRFQGVTSKRFKCPKCAATFEVKNPTLESPVIDLPMSDDVSRASAPLTVPQAPPSVPATVPQAPPPSPLTVPQALQPAPALVHEPMEEAPPAAGASKDARDTTSRRDRHTLMTSIKNAGAIPLGWRISLAFLNGPQASSVKPLEKAITVIGREEGDIVTRDPETSRRHLSIEIHNDGSVWLTDLGSTNGTYVDGVQIHGTIQLSDRQEFSCGKCNFMVLIRKEDPNHPD